jgi:hypothetical protein
MYKKYSSKAALLAGLALASLTSSAYAAVVCGPAANLSIPANIDGVYLNLVTGATGTAGAGTAGWDLNAYQTGTPASLFLFWPTTPANSFGGVAAGTVYSVLNAGDPIGPGQTYSVASGGGGAANFVNLTGTTGDKLVGVRFFNEATSAINFGWMRLNTTATSGFPATIVQYCYQNDGSQILAGDTGGPANTAPTLTYSPTTAAGVSFPAGPAGAANSSIAISSAGAVGTGQSAVTGCSITGAGAASFGAVTTTPANGVFNTATTSGAISLSCTRGASAATASLSCTETATPTVAGSPFTRTWALTCPAAVVTNVAPVGAVAPTTLTAGTGSVTPTITTPAQGAGSTVFSCSIPATAPSNFAIASNASQTLTNAAPAAIGLTCAPQAAATQATLTCTQTATPGPNPANATAVVTCPAALAGVSPGTVSGTTINLPVFSLPSTGSSRSLSFTSTGNASVLSCTTTGAGFSVAPNPLNLATGVPGSVTVSYTGTTVGTFTGTLTCTSNTAGGPFVYPLGVVVSGAVVSVPTLGQGGLWLLILGAMGLGLLSISAGRRD